ncbi:hypothetical protein [Kitasatospora sp. NPDC057015]|uniref:hypothetical protein n=1 Tax=Kitasatospora sp. NPDC057015 TaxID=3346001 RepID=UPI003641641C
MRGPGWLAEHPAVAGALLLPLAGGWIGWWVQRLPGAGVGVLVGLLVAAALAALVELG